MAFSVEIEAFIREFIKDLAENNVGVFAGAGLSMGQGYVDWKGLLREIATDLNLIIDRETDLLGIAQFSVNEWGNRARLNRKILEEFTEEAEIGENHRILARLPITTYWTTNYDTLIEDALEEANKRPDVKHTVTQLAVTKPRRDAVVYKMHGDVNHPAEAIITKQQYQAYYKEHEAFITALSGDLTSKTFIFIGFSFTDPNLEYVLGRLSIQFKENPRQHYCFVKKPDRNEYKSDEDFEYATVRHPLMINDLKRYGIQALQLDSFGQITEVLQEIERRFKKKTVFISGSAEEYGSSNRREAQEFIHALSKALISSGFRVVNGFGWGVGSAVINGALEAISENPRKFSTDQLILRPFPQFETGGRPLAESWEEYRQNMISLAGIAVFIYGNKLSETGEVINANGVRREFQISTEKAVIPIPIGQTGYMSKEIADEILADPGRYYPDRDWLTESVGKLNSAELSNEQAIDEIVKSVKKLQEKE